MKQLLAILVLLAVAAGAYYWWSTYAPPVATETQHLLQGEQIGEGYYLYRESEPYYTIEVMYPPEVPLAAPEAQAKAQLTLERALETRINEFKQNGNFANLTQEDIEIQGLGEGRKYALDMEYKEQVSSSGLVSYLYTIYEDTLGAHPNGYYLTFVFDMQGNELAISDLFISGSDYLNRLSLLTSLEVTAQMKVRTGLDDVSDSLFAEGLAAKDENFENFTIMGGNLLIHIPPYQVAAYAVGMFEVAIPLSDLKDILKPGIL